MLYPNRLLRKGILVKEMFLISILTFFSFGSAKATTVDSTALYKTILYIGNIKEGPVPDTIIGKAGSDRHFIPDRIVWGRDTSSQYYPNSLRKQSTPFIYPNWVGLRASINIDKMNSDTLNDMVFVIWGKLQLDSTHYENKANAFTIFGRRGYDTLTAFNLASVDSFQLDPFISMKLKKNTDLTECNQRDYSGIKSYRINKMELPPPPRIFSEVQDEAGGTLRIYPNPAVYYTNIELNKMKAGGYRIVLSALDGATVSEQEFSISQTDCIEHVLDLQNVSTGTYYLKLYADTKYLGTYSLMVIH